VSGDVIPQEWLKDVSEDVIPQERSKDVSEDVIPQERPQGRECRELASLRNGWLR
jgi:hypothetical protein